MLDRISIETSLGSISTLWRKGNPYAVFLHGMGGSGNNWLRIATNLPDHFGLILPDLLGHGRSDKPNIPYEINQQCTAINEVLQALSVNRSLLLGHSYGGWIATRLQLRHNIAPRTVLVDSAGLNPAIGEFSNYLEGFLDSAMRMNAMNSRDILRRILQNNSRPEEKLKEVDLKALKGEYLLIWGSVDSMIPVSYGRELNRLIPRSRLEIIENAGHLPHVDNPERVAELVSSFFAVK